MKLGLAKNIQINSLEIGSKLFSKTYDEIKKKIFLIKIRKSI